MKNKYQKIKIEGNEYFVVDSIQDLRAEDSFIYRKNKLAMYGGSGEARKYVGSYTGSKGEALSNFFEYKKWGDCLGGDGKRIYPIIQSKCFFSRSNLLKYLNNAQTEYYKKEQIYNFDISEFYNQRLEKITSMETDKVFFNIYDVSDLKEKKSSRGYIRSDENIWKTWRTLILPKISYLSILKLVPVDSSQDSTPLFYFRILLDYQFRSIVHPQLLDSPIIDTETGTIDSKKSPSREGQQKYRKGVIEHMPQCPFTKISDERLLIASHIKPYRACIKESKIKESIDYLNGLALSPTYDKLFDQGYITFTNKGELICGTLLTPYTWERLNINPSAKNLLRIYPEDREKYLEYHRINVFQDDINEFI